MEAHLTSGASGVPSHDHDHAHTADHGRDPRIHEEYLREQNTLAASRTRGHDHGHEHGLGLVTDGHSHNKAHPHGLTLIGQHHPPPAAKPHQGSSASMHSVASTTHGLSMEHPSSTRLELETLKRTFEPVLVAALSELCLRRPTDPLEYLGHWLLRYRYNEDAKRREVEDALDAIKEEELERAREAELHTVYSSDLGPESEEGEWHDEYEGENSSRGGGGSGDTRGSRSRSGRHSRRDEESHGEYEAAGTELEHETEEAWATQSAHHDEGKDADRVSVGKRKSAPATTTTTESIGRKSGGRDLSDLEDPSLRSHRS